ncbi:hypothetical protein J6590_083934 [Homalodisca vitripennis]|nr:hypothetical protein J6590_083934 [Homalodisca vitripennis]
MFFTLENNRNGKDFIIIDIYKYREQRTYANGDINWRCLGRSCNASIRTDASKSKIITVLNDKHSGDHPTTMRSLSKAAGAPSPSAAGRASPASPAPAASAAASASLCASPLLSQSILAKKTYDIACQTEDIHLKSKDELVARVKELTILQSNLVDKIQDLTRQLEETKKKKKTEKYETKKECAETQTNIEVTHIKSTQTEDACTQQSACKKCVILQDETKKLISTIRTMEDDQIRNSGFPIYPDNLSIRNSYSVLEEEGCGGAEVMSGRDIGTVNRKVVKRRKKLRGNKKKTDEKKLNHRNCLNHPEQQAIPDSTLTSSMSPDFFGVFSPDTASISTGKARQLFVINYCRRPRT